MPTGFTADLEKRNYNLQSWLKESIIRGMGVCVTLRDYDAMTEKEILEALEKEKNEPYHAKKLAERQKALAEFKALNGGQLSFSYEQERSIAEQDFIKRKEKFEKNKAAHLEAISETDRLLDLAISEGQSIIIINSLKFALEQLQSAFTHDYQLEPYKDKVLTQSFDQWFMETQLKLLNDISYHAKELEKEARSSLSRFNDYREYVAWVDSIFEKKV